MGSSSSSSSLELNLSLKPSYVPKTIANLLKDLSNLGNTSEKLAVLNDYINQHEEELNNIVAFKHQLPQCMLLLTEALGTLKDEFTNIEKGMESKNTGHGRPDLMEFLAIKTKEYEKKQTDNISVGDHDRHKNDYKGKSLMIGSSLHPPHPQQIWNSKYETKKQQETTFIDFIKAPNQNPNISPYKESGFRVSVGEERCSTKDQIIRGSAADSKFGSIGTKNNNNNNNNNNNKGHCGLNLRANNQTLNYHPRPLTQPIWKNSRRTWSPELHSRFVEALNLLGGIEVATPKQIREVMQVEGLTNDQVKSHLQKYRLHCRRLPTQNYGECLLKFQHPWHPQIHYGDPWASQDSDQNNCNTRRITQ